MAEEAGTEMEKRKRIEKNHSGAQVKTVYDRFRDEYGVHAAGME